MASPDLEGMARQMVSVRPLIQLTFGALSI
jgi:hypothetical protein